MPPSAAGRRIAVALHDVEPATFARCALIRDWLADLGVDRVTLLVIPAPDLHPFFQRSPELAAWLHERRASGDAVAQHGLTRVGPANLSGDERRAHVLAGHRLLTLAGLAPRGFVAPGPLHRRQLRSVLSDRFDWWAPARMGRRVSQRERAGRREPALLRIDLHPHDFDHPGSVLALERLVRRNASRAAVTYDDVADLRPSNPAASGRAAIFTAR